MGVPRRQPRQIMRAEEAGLNPDNGAWVVVCRHGATCDFETRAEARSVDNDEFCACCAVAYGTAPASVMARHGERCEDCA